MAKGLTNSKIDRQNILNNNFAMNEIEKACDLKGILFEDKIAFTKERIASFYEIDIRTVERYLEDNKEEFNENGYEVLKGTRLKRFIEIFNNQGTDINVGTIPKATTVLGDGNFQNSDNVKTRRYKIDIDKSLTEYDARNKLQKINIK